MNAERGGQVWLGIDFSGDHRRWRRLIKGSNIYIAEVHNRRELPLLTKLQTVQELPGEEGPFQKLINRLKVGNFDAAAIDAPFSVPKEYLPLGGDHKALLKLVAKLERPKNRPFASAQDFVCSVLAGRPILNKKPLRETECYWSSKGINVRSTLWFGPRGGAAMTTACLTLLQESGCPIWPWHQHRLGEGGLLVEAFPAAQLCRWEMKFDKYDGDKQGRPANRAALVGALSKRIEIPNDLIDIMKQSSDALDAVICAFAAIAVCTGRVMKSASPMLNDEGLIAIHD